jgi:threonine/homoserine/homoserine lactone efflux protein
MTDPILFLLAVATILGTPGPTNTLLATSGATVGMRRSLPLLAGELAGYLIAVSAIRLVLGPVIAAWPLLGVILKVAVIAYLVWIAVRLWQHGNRSLTEAGAEIRVQNVFITTLLNPKALIFALSVLPQAHPALWAYFLAFLAIIPAAGFSWIIVGRAIGLAAGDRHTGTVRKVASVALFGFAGLIAASVMG